MIPLKIMRYPIYNITLKTNRDVSKYICIRTNCMALETQKGDIWFFAYEKFTEFDRIVFCINGLIPGKINIKRSTKIHTHTHACTSNSKFDAIGFHNFNAN